MSVPRLLSRAWRYTGNKAVGILLRSQQGRMSFGYVGDNGEVLEPEMNVKDLYAGYSWQEKRKLFEIREMLRMRRERRKRG